MGTVSVIPAIAFQQHSWLLGHARYLLEDHSKLMPYSSTPGRRGVNNIFVGTL